MLLGLPTAAPRPLPASATPSGATRSLRARRLTPPSAAKAGPLAATMSPLFLGLDVGTQGTKAVVYNASTSSIVGRGAASYNLLPSKDPNCGEQHPSQWRDGIVEAVRGALAGVDAGGVQGIGVSGQQHGFVPVDAEGEVIRPAKLWCDTVSTSQAAQLAGEFGWEVLPAFTASKILWMKENEPENFARLTKVMLPHDWVNFWLTGRWAMECGDASGSGLLDLPSRTWRAEWVAAVDPSLSKMLPELVDPDQAIGALLEPVAAELGLPAGVVVSPGGGDNMMSALGAGAVSEGRLVMSLGTSGTLFSYSSTPLLDPTGVVAPFCDSTGAYLPLLCTMNCTTAAEEVRKGYGISIEEITALAAGEPAGCGGFNFLPYLVGARTPNWPHASGVMAGLRPGSLSRPGLLYRAAMEGATFSLLAGYKKMEEMGLKADEVLLVGGGSKNAVWRQIVADAFQFPVRIPVEAESGALGAAMQAAAVHSGAGVAEYVRAHMPAVGEEPVRPNPANKALYEEAFARHVALGEKLFSGGG